MLGGVIDFLEFSEGNLAWQRQREIRKAQQEGALVEFEPPDEHLAPSYRVHLIESAEYRFDIGLSQNIRYAGLVTFVTALELCAKAFSKRLTQSIEDAPTGENEHVYLFSCLNRLSSSGFDNYIDDLRRLVFARNCIVHAAGFIERYKFEKDIREAVQSLKGFTIWNEDYLGTSIRIEEGAVERYAKAAKEWVPKLDERCTTAEILKG